MPSSNPVLSTHAHTPTRIHPPYSVESRSAGHSTLAAEAPRALAALRCLPCLVGSFSRTEDTRRNAIEKPLGLIEDLLAACSAWDAAPVSADSEKETPDTPPADGGTATKRGRKRRQSANGKAAAAVVVDKAVVAGSGGDDDQSSAATAAGGDQTDGGCGGARSGARDEMAVVQAYALEAGVGLCCLLPGDEEGGGERRRETLERLIGWHGR